MILIVIILLVLFGAAPFGFGDDLAGTDCEAADASVDGCDASAAGDAWQPVRIDDVQGVIVAEADAGLFIGTEAYWTPSLADVRAAEAALMRQQGALDHTRQYVGFIDSGQPKLLINGFRDDHGVDWRRIPVMVLDGGDCFFTAIYAVDTDSLERFDYNGEA